MTRPLLIAFFILAPLTGCMSRQEHALFRDGLDRATLTMRAEHLEWSRALANDPSKLPQLHDGETEAERAAWLAAREGWHQDYAGYMDASRGNDGR